MMGDGVADIRRLRSAAEAAGFNGFIETEIFSTYWWSVPEEDVLRTCAERMTGSC
jgi:sugar phosphate isomerase/epimerase